jgi:hypothetical protein
LELLEFRSTEILFDGYFFEAADDPAHIALLDSPQALTDELPRLIAARLAGYTR